MVALQCKRCYSEYIQNVRAGRALQISEKGTDGHGIQSSQTGDGDAVDDDGTQRLYPISALGARMQERGLLFLYASA